MGAGVLRHDDGVTHPTDRRGRFWAWLYNRGQRQIDRLGYVQPAWGVRLTRWAKRRPIVGSMVQGAAFGLLMAPLFCLLLLPTLLAGHPRLYLILAVVTPLALALFFGLAMAGYNSYVRRNGEAWADASQRTDWHSRI